MWSYVYYWILAKYLTLLAFMLTLVIVRTLAALARRSVPFKIIQKRDTFFSGLIYVSAGLVVAVILWCFRRQAGVTWISESALYLSLALDLFFLGGVLFYCYALKRLRKHPDRFPYKVTVVETLKWPDSAVVTHPLRLGLSQLGMVRKWSAPEFQITPPDFTGPLRRNPRLLDDISDGSILGYSKSEIDYFPHLVSEFEKSQDNGAGVHTEKKANAKAVMVGDAHRTLNRALVSGLPDNLWNTSIRLCQSSPQIIATTWKQFYQQKSLRLRLVSLFNTVEMFQRLIGAIALVTLRDEDFPEPEFVIGETKIPESMNHWNQALRGVLERTTTPTLAPLRRVLLTIRDDFDDLLKELTPLREILGDGIIRIDGTRDTLAGWKLLGELRNKLIGHGGVGWKLSVDMTNNLSSLHFFFLAMMKDVSRFDLGVLAVHRNSDLIVIGLDKGLNRALNASGPCLALARVPESNKVVELNPYFRFNTGRLLAIDGYRDKSAIAEYTDYNSADPLEPSFFSFPEHKSSFIQNRHGQGLSFTALGASLRENLTQVEIALSEAIQKTNLAANLARQDNCEEALVAIDQAIAHCKSLGSKEVRYFSVMAESFFASAVKANCFLKRGRTDEALALANPVSTYALRLSDSVDNFATVWDFLILSERTEVIKEAAFSLLGLGRLLVSSGNFEKALVCSHLAFSMFENVPEGNWEGVPFSSFAVALFDKAYSLYEYSEWTLAIANYEKVIILVDDLLDKIAKVEQSSQNEILKFDNFTESADRKLSTNFANIPAGNLLSKPIRRGLGKLIPVELFKNIIEITSSVAINQAHEKYGSPYLLRNLSAQAWGNMGLSFQKSGDLTKSASCIEEALKLHRQLLEDSDELEQAKELARTLENQALLFSEMARWKDAVDTYADATDLRERCIKAGMLEEQPKLLRILRLRVQILLRLEEWEHVAAGILHFTDYMSIQGQKDSQVELVRDEVQLFISDLRKVPHEGLKSVLSFLGQDAGRMKELMNE